MDRTWNKKQIWEVYNEFCDLLQKNKWAYTTKSYVDPDGITIFNIRIFEIVDTSMGRYGFEVASRNIAIRLGEIEDCIIRGYESCINMLLKVK